MFKSPVLKLPPELRLAIVGNRIASLQCQPVSSSQDCHGPLRGGHSALRRARDGRRSYATVHSDETSKLWNQHGKDSSTEFSSEKGSQEEGAIAQEGACSWQTRRQVVALAEQIASTSAPADRSEVLASLYHAAMKTEDPLLAMMNLSNFSPNASSEHKPMDRPDGHKLAGVKRSSQKARIRPSNSQLPKASDEVSSSQVVEERSIQLLDLKHVQDNMRLPTMAAYPQALPELFDPTRVSVAIAGICQMLRLPFDIEVNFAPKKGVDKGTVQRLFPGKQQIFACNLKLDIADVCQETADGEGDRKQTAKQAAWVSSLSKRVATS